MEVSSAIGVGITECSAVRCMVLCLSHISTFDALSQSFLISVSYHAGRPLRGRVEVVMGASARKATPTVLSLVLKGKEKTKKAVRRFFSVTLPLTNNRPIDIHENSTYNFPFSIPLPGSLPSSTRYFTDPEHARSGCTPKFEIEYSASVRASAGSEGAQDTPLV